VAVARAEVLNTNVVAARRSRSFSTAGGGEKGKGQAPEGEPFFWRQPSCRRAKCRRPAVPGCWSAALRRALALGGWPPRVFDPFRFSILLCRRAGRAARALATK